MTEDWYPYNYESELRAEELRIQGENEKMPEWICFRFSHYSEEGRVYSLGRKLITVGRMLITVNDKDEVVSFSNE